LTKGNGSDINTSGSLELFFRSSKKYRVLKEKQMGYCTVEEWRFVQKLKEQKILRPFTEEDFSGLTQNGGVWTRCSDGDIDDSMYCRKTISPRHHELKYAGGVLNLSPSFAGYRKTVEDVFVEDVVTLFKAKKTKSLFLGDHYPCAVATEYSTGIEAVVRHAYLVHERGCTDLKDRINSLLPPELHLVEDRVFDFFHFKRLNEQGEEQQETYYFDADLYAEYYIYNQAA
jgi:hypothetical protein